MEYEYVEVDFKSAKLQIYKYLLLPILLDARDTNMNQVWPLHAVRIKLRHVKQ